VRAVNPNVVLTLIAGYPYAFAKEEKLTRAVIYTSHGEQCVGAAAAGALFGKVNPAGRLSMTWYLSQDDLPDIGDYDIINSPRTYMYFDKPVQYPFGYGLSYTSFSYSGLSVEGSADGFAVTCAVRNSGKSAGDEVVQLYAALEGVDIKAPRRQLVGFERVALTPGEVAVVRFDVPMTELTLFDEAADAFAILPKAVLFSAGASSEDLRLSEKVIIER
jgi:beta-glucosidase